MLDLKAGRSTDGPTVNADHDTHRLASRSSVSTEVPLCCGWQCTERHTANQGQANE